MSPDHDAQQPLALQLQQVEDELSLVGGPTGARLRRGAPAGPGRMRSQR
jgi:hypothetical protein